MRALQFRWDDMHHVKCILFRGDRGDRKIALDPNCCCSACLEAFSLIPKVMRVIMTYHPSQGNPIYHIFNCDLEENRATIFHGTANWYWQYGQVDHGIVSTYISRDLAGNVWRNTWVNCSYNGMGGIARWYTPIAEHEKCSGFRYEFSQPGFDYEYEVFPV